MPKSSKKEGSAEGLTKVENVRLQEKLIENLVELQKVHTGMAEKFDKLSNQIVNLLTLFEMAARSFAEHPANQGTEKDKEFLDKINKLLDQNKTIAKGLTLMEDRLRERLYGAPVPTQNSTNDQSEKQVSRDEEYQSSAMNRSLPKF
ncbi:MAG: hypothetical protein AABX85_00590 [Nanoarchaeota archaeon]